MALFPRVSLVAASLVAIADAGIFDVDIPSHPVGNWRGKNNYLVTYEYVSPGQDTSAAILNSCSADVPSAFMCNGHGRCIHWNDNADSTFAQSRLTFCQCDMYWADPECRTQRKSQVTAFLLSLFFGFLGADQFYLGYVLAGVLKLVTLGGCGLWYLYDVVRIGSSAVYTEQSQRVAADLPHWAYVLAVVSLMCFLGFAVSIRTISRHRVNKAREVLILKAEQAAALAEEGPSVNFGKAAMAGFRGYGTTL